MLTSKDKRPKVYERLQKERLDFFRLLHLEVDIEKDEDFVSLVRAAIKYFNMSDLEAADLFEVSRPTATRWRQGVTTPGKATRKLVKKILDELEENRYWDYFNSRAKDLDAIEQGLRIAIRSFRCTTLEEAYEKMDNGYLRGSTAYSQPRAIKDLLEK